MAKFISKIQVNLNHSVEIMVGVQASIYLLNRKMGDVPKYHTTIWCAMVDIMKKLISRGSVLDNIDLDLLMKEVREAHLLLVNTKTSMDDAMEQATSEALKI